LRRQTAVAVLPVRRTPARLRAGLLSLTAIALLSVTPGAAPAFADDPSAGAGGAAIASTEVTLREGDRGRAVRRLQRKLRVSADGVFGSQTARAVKRFQRRNGLAADGIVGPMTRGKLGLARFSSAEVRHPPQDAPADGGDVELPRVLREIAQCESGGDPRAVSSNGLYRGKFQFSRSTWKAIGGRGSDPAQASETHQDRMALRLYRQRGVAPWPACGARATS
jgi:peptidoglycan hydrolase-like protein with peptidoglycan-binding domain